MKLKPFLKWIGGKGEIADRLASLAPKEYGRYYEAFVGGGAAFLTLCPERAVIGDVNAQLINCYRQIKADVDSVICEIASLDFLPCEAGYYYAIRDEFNRMITADEQSARSAAVMIWLNKHCFNGLYRVNSKGLFNAAFNRKVKLESVDRGNLYAISDYLNSGRIEIRNGDFEETCVDVRTNDLVYFDPPYLAQKDASAFVDYTGERFSIDDHKRLAEYCKRLTTVGVNVITTNSDAKLVEELYADFHMERVDVRRRVNCDGANRTGRDLIIVNY